MLGRKDYTKEELAHAKATVAEQLAAFDGLTAAAKGKVEGTYFTNMVLVLDRLFVHRLRAVAGKDGNALNEVELLVESLMASGGVFRGNNVIKYVPEQSVLKLKPGDPVRLTRDEYDRLSAAFLAEIKKRFVSP